MCCADPARQKLFLRIGAVAVLVLVIVSFIMMLTGGVQTFKIKLSDYAEDLANSVPGVSPATLRRFVDCEDADDLFAPLGNEDERDIEVREACAGHSTPLYFIGISSVVFLCCAVVGVFALFFPTDERVALGAGGVSLSFALIFVAIGIYNFFVADPAMVYKDCPVANQPTYCLGGDPKGVVKDWLGSVATYYVGAAFALIALTVLSATLHCAKSAAAANPPASAAIPASASTGAKNF